MTAPGQGTPRPLHPHRGQVIEHQRTLLEVPRRQTPLDPLLAFQEPVHGAVEVVLVQPGIEDLAQGAHRRGLGQAPGRGQLRGGLQDPGCDHGQHLVASRRGPGIDELLQAELLACPQHRGDVTVGQGADDVEGVLEAGHRGASLEQDAQSLDESGRPAGEVGEGALLDLAALAIGLAEQDGGRGGAIGHGFDVHGYE